MQDSLEIVIAIISILGFIGTGFAYLRTKIEKSYAAQRDFAHLKNSFKQLEQGINLLDEQGQEIKAELKEIKAFTSQFSLRMDAILTRLEANSAIWGRRE